MAHTITQANLDSFTNNNATLYLDGVEAKVGDTLDGNLRPPDTLMEAKADAGFKFTSQTFPTSRSSVALITGDGNRVDFDVGSPPTTATLQTGVDRGVTFDVETVSNADYTVKARDMTTASENRSTFYRNGDAFYEGMPLMIGDTIKGVVDSGYHFTKVQYYTRTSGIGGQVAASYTLSEPPTEATMTLDDKTEIVVYNVSTEQLAADTKGNNNVYLADRKIMKAVNAQRFAQNVSDKTVVDFGRYILGLIELPTEVPESYQLDNTFIQLGDNSLTVKATELSKDVIDVDMGTVNVPEKYGDFRDFQNTVCNLHLPYAGSVAVEAEYIIGQTLRIEYLIDVYNGKATVNLYSTALGVESFYTLSADLGISIPYAADSGQALHLENANISLGGDNRLTKCYVEIMRNESPLAEKFFSVPVNDEGALGEQSGYVEVDNVALDFQALGDEMRDIETALSGGVVIK